MRKEGDELNETSHLITSSNLSDSKCQLISVNGDDCLFAGDFKILHQADKTQHKETIYAYSNYIWSGQTQHPECIINMCVCVALEDHYKF